jgi:hypothetical protein
MKFRISEEKQTSTTWYRIEYLTKFLWWEFWQNAAHGSYRFCIYIDPSYTSLEAAEKAVEIIKKSLIPNRETIIKEFEL